MDGIENLYGFNRVIVSWGDFDSIMFVVVLNGRRVVYLDDGVVIRCYICEFGSGSGYGFIGKLWLIDFSKCIVLYRYDKGVEIENLW